MKFFKKNTYNKTKVLKGILYFILLPVLTHATKTSSDFPNSLDTQIETIEVLYQNHDSIQAIELAKILIKSLDEKITKDQFRKIVKLKEKLFASDELIAQSIKADLSLYNLFCKKEVEDNNFCGPCRSIQYSLGRRMQSIQKYQSSIKYFNEICPSSFHFYDAYHLALSHQKIGRIDSAYWVLQQKIDESIHNEDWYAVSRTYNNMGLIAQRANDFVFSIESFDQAIEYAEKFHGSNRAFISVVKGNLGASYLNLGDFDVAKDFLLYDMEESLEHGLIESFLNASIIYSQLDFQTKRYVEAKNRLDSLLSNKELPWTDDKKIDAYKILLKTYVQLRNKEGAENLIEQIGLLEEKRSLREVAFDDRVMKSFTEQMVESINNEREQELKINKQELEILKTASTRRELIFILILTLIIFSILTALLLFLRFRREKIQEIKLNESKTQLIEKEKEILEIRFLEELRNAEQLSLELTYKEQIVDRFKKKLKIEDISTANKKSLEIFLENELKINSIRAEIQGKLGESRSSFYLNLKKRHPNLTSNETNLASLVVLEKSNKEIANSKSIAVTSVKQAKNRLKKKLMITEKDQLHIYLREFLS